MSTKRTTRSASAKPSSKPPPERLKKPIPRAKSVTTRKRAASPAPQPIPLPPRKRSREDVNLVLTPPEKKRPCLQLFVWGAGNFGQFGMGPNVLGELSKPKKNPWIDEQIQAHVFGENFGGLESIAAGGMHTIFIDEKGTVRIFLVVPKHDKLLSTLARFGHVVSTMMLLSVVSLKMCQIRIILGAFSTSTNLHPCHIPYNLSSTRISGQSKSSLEIQYPQP